MESSLGNNNLVRNSFDYTTKKISKVCSACVNISKYSVLLSGCYLYFTNFKCIFDD